jgi:hypothetical protein
MDVLVLVAIAVGVLALGALPFVPLLLPWPQRVRWTVAVQAMGDVGSAPAMFPPPDLREIVLVSVDVDVDGPILTVLETGRRDEKMRIFHTTTAVPSAVRTMLREWSALRTPMLLHTDAAGDVSLTGPAATVVGLRSAGNRRRHTASEPPHLEGAP